MPAGSVSPPGSTTPRTPEQPFRNVASSSPTDDASEETWKEVRSWANTGPAATPESSAGGGSDADQPSAALVPEPASAAPSLPEPFGLHADATVEASIAAVATNVADSTVARNGDAGGGEASQHAASAPDVGSGEPPKKEACIANVSAESTELPQQAPSDVDEFLGTNDSHELTSPATPPLSRDSSSNNPDHAPTSSVSVLADGFSVKMAARSSNNVATTTINLGQVNSGKQWQRL
mmetsp:Transcript_117847/g.234778  ORF Transcript_117847/g.234778 Transcript_117847/m.234778 type:complete len:236 (-) Transcript_117847:130-837(-)